MGSLGPTIANAFVCFFKQLEQGFGEFKLVSYRRQVDYIFEIFESQDH